MDEQDQFEIWVDEMTDALEQFVERLPPAVAQRLDYSEQSLDALESCILERYPDFESVQRDADVSFSDGAARYVGEVFRKALGARWDISFQNPRDVNHGLPVIIGFRGQQTALAPHSLVAVSTDRRTGKYLSTILRNQLAIAKAAS